MGACICTQMLQGLHVMLQQLLPLLQGLLLMQQGLLWLLLLLQVLPSLLQQGLP